MVRKENYFRLLAILLPIFAITVVGATLQYWYNVVFVGSIQSVGVTLYSNPSCEDQYIIPQNEPQGLLGNLTDGWNNYTLYIKNTGWYDNITVTYNKTWTTSNDSAVRLNVKADFPNGRQLAKIGDIIQMVLKVEVVPVTPNYIPEGITYTITLVIEADKT